MSVSKFCTRRFAVVPVLVVLATAACSQGQKVASRDVTEGSCAQAGLKQGLAYFQPPSSTVVVATVGTVGEPQLEGRDRSATVYTPVTLTGLEVLSGSSAPTKVFFRGGTAEGHSTSAENYLGLVPGGKVLMAIGTDPAALGGPVADPPGPYVQTTLPIDAQDNVLVSGCMNADDVTGSVHVTAGVDTLTAQSKVEKVTVTGSRVPLAAVRAVVRQVLAHRTPYPSTSTSS